MKTTTNRKRTNKHPPTRSQNGPNSGISKVSKVGFQWSQNGPKWGPRGASKAKISQTSTQKAKHLTASFVFGPKGYPKMLLKWGPGPSSRPTGPPGGPRGGQGMIFDACWEPFGSHLGSTWSPERSKEPPGPHFACFWALFERFWARCGPHFS